MRFSLRWKLRTLLWMVLMMLTLPAVALVPEVVQALQPPLLVAVPLLMHRVVELVLQSRMSLLEEEQLFIITTTPLHLGQSRLGVPLGAGSEAAVGTLPLSRAFRHWAAGRFRLLPPTALGPLQPLQLSDQALLSFTRPRRSHLPEADTAMGGHLSLGLLGLRLWRLP